MPKLNSAAAVQTEHLHIRIEPQLKDELHKLSEKTRRPASDHARQALEEYLARHERK